MKAIRHVRFVAIAVFLGLVSSGATATAAVEEVDPTPKIEVAFVLDTTGSMSGLIAGAKQKIWAITHQIVSGRPTPAIKLGLVGYRDRGDEYVTRLFDLTTDLDLIYGHLTEFQARNGGDMPESVNQALHEAVTRMSWSKDTNTLKIIFLVGDAPPHMDYPDDVKYPETIRLANKAGIIINTIQCGAMAQTTPVWQEIASAAEGAFVRIEQSGGMRATSTPMDGEISRLSSDLARTVVPYGDPTKQAEVRSKAANAGGAAADRVVVLNVDRAEFGAKMVVTGEGELIWDVVNRKVNLEDIRDADLPAQMKTMTMEERKAFVDEQFGKRKDLQIQVDALAVQRDAYIRAEMRRQTEQGARDSFDAKVVEMVQTQALRRGIKYDMTAPAAAPSK